MARKFLIPITPPSLSSDPISSSTASIYFNTTDNELKIFNGSAWTGIADSYLSKANTFTVGPQTINTGVSSNPGLVIKGASGQNSGAALTVWQNSVGTTLAQVSGTGRIYSSVSLTAGSLSSALGALTSVATSSTVIGAVIRGAASQTANLQEWQDSTGTSLATIGANGNTWFRAGARVSGNYGGSQALFIQNDQNIIGLTIKANTTQTADLQQWQNSAGGLLAYMSSAGRLTLDWVTASVIRTNYVVNPADNGPFFLLTSTNASLTNRNTVSNVVFTVNGMSGQTGNLQEWKDSSGTVLAKVDSAGGFTAGNTFLTSTSSSTVSLIVKAATSQTANILEIQNPSSGVIFAVTPSAEVISYRRFSVFSPSAATIGLIVKAAASQTADLQQWQNSSGTALVSITSAGQVNFQGSAYVDIYGQFVTPTTVYANGIQNNTGYWTFNNNGVGAITARAATNIPLTLKGAASQSANLQEWQDSAGSVLLNIDSTGNLNIGAGSSNIWKIKNQTSTVMEWQPSQGFMFLPYGSSNKPVTIKGAASQTGNLTEWQDSNGTVYAFINPYGQLSIGQSPTIYSNARISINTVATTVVGQVIRGVASQTANLQEWQGDGGSVLSTVGPLGAVNINTSNANALGAIGIGALEVKRTAFFDTGTTTNVGIIVRGRASQTADLQQWQDSTGTALAAITSSGDYLTPSGKIFRTYSNSTFGSLMLWDGGNNNTTLRPASSGFLIMNNGVVGMNVVKVRGASGQTGNLQEWQNSSGTVLSAITSIGQKTIGSSIPLTNSAVQQSITGVTFTSTTATYTFTSTLQTMTVGDYVTISGIDPVGYNGTFQVTAIATVSAGSSYSFTVANTTNTTVVTGTGLVALSAGLSVTIPDKAHTGIIIKAAANQSAAMMEFRTSTGALSTWWDANGAMTASTAAISTLYSGGFMNTGTLGYFNATTFNPAVSPVVIRGAASQSTHYLQIQNSIGTLLWGINSSGESSTRTTTKFGANIQNDSNNANTALSVSAPSTSGNGIALYVYSGSTTRDIAKFDNSGVVKLTVTSDGSLKGGNSSTISVNTATTVDTVALSSFTTIEYTLSIKQGSKIRSSKVLVHTDGTSVDSTEYGIIEMGGGITGILVEVSVSSTNSILQITITDAATTNATVKLIKTML